MYVRVLTPLYFSYKITLYMYAKNKSTNLIWVKWLKLVITLILSEKTNKTQCHVHAIPSM